MIKELKNHCDKFLQSLTEVPRNKRELQFLLTSYLKQYYNRVFVDYEVPLNLLAKFYFEVSQKYIDGSAKPLSYPWEEKVCSDIVVEKGLEYAVINLNYIVASAYSCPSVFDRKVNNIVNDIPTHIVKYDFWKDVHKIEALANIPRVVGGFVILLTNEEKLWSPEESSENPRYPFSIFEGATVEPGKLGTGECSFAEQPDFTIDGKYKCHWKDTKILDGDQYTSPDWYRYMLLPIKQERPVNCKIKVICDSEYTLLLGIINAYLSLYPECTFEDLCKVFPTEIASGHEILLPVQKAESLKGFDKLFYLTNSDKFQIITLSDENKYALYTQSVKIDMLIGMASKLGIHAVIKDKDSCGSTYGYVLIRSDKDFQNSKY